MATTTSPKATEALPLSPSHDANPSQYFGNTCSHQLFSASDHANTSGNANQAAFHQNATASNPSCILQEQNPSASDLHLQMDISHSATTTDERSSLIRGTGSGQHRPAPIRISGSPRPIFVSNGSFDSTASILSPSLSIPSPFLASLSDVTPLPSPLNPTDSPDLWKKQAGRPHSTSSSGTAHDEAAGLLGLSALPSSPWRKKKHYPTLASSPPTNTQDNVAAHGRNRSISEFVPDTLHNVRQRNATMPISTMHELAEQQSLPPDQYMHREQQQHAGQRRPFISDPIFTLPSPPTSHRSTTDSDEGEDSQATAKRQFEIPALRTGPKEELTYWTPVRSLGQGTFSQVVLATSETKTAASPAIPFSEQNLDPASLVAIKIVTHDPTGGAKEERMETSIKREIDILQSISHPCLPQLQAFDNNSSRALLVLNYCPGGDLFELASQQRELLTPALIQRIFAEMVDAVGYLHSQMIVHRDIKLENILLNLPTTHLPPSPSTHRSPFTTLTDLGLSRHIPSPPLSPLLTHPCGSADYAAPELLLGQPYDGRATDAWALGVLLYALIEGRLPFDAADPEFRSGGGGGHVRTRRRRRGQGSSVKHRIARCDWLWCEFGDEEGEWDAGRSSGKGAKGRGEMLEGGRECVEGLLRKAGRGRWGLERLRGEVWVRDGIVVEGGMRRMGL